MIADVEGDFHDLTEMEIPDTLPILAVRNLVLFPGVVSPILIGREASMALIRKAEKNNMLIGVFTQRDPDVEMPIRSDLYDYGVIGKVLKTLTLPNGNITTIVQGLGRVKLEDIIKYHPYLEGHVSKAPEEEPDKHDVEFRTAMDDLRQSVTQYINLMEDIPDEATFALKNVNNNIMALNFVCSNMPFSAKEKMKLLMMDSITATRHATTSTSSSVTTSCNSRLRTCRLRWATRVRPRRRTCWRRPVRRIGPRISRSSSTRNWRSWTR